MYLAPVPNQVSESTLKSQVGIGTGAMDVAKCLFMQADTAVGHCPCGNGTNASTKIRQECLLVQS